MPAELSAAPAAAVSWASQGASLAVALHLMAVETLAGMLLFLHAVVAPADAAGLPRGGGLLSAVEPWCRRLAVGLLIAMALSALAWLLAVAADLGGGGGIEALRRSLPILLTGTEFGLIWILRLGVTLLLLLLVWLKPTARRLADDGLPWAGLLLLTVALTGHGGAAGGTRHHLMLTITGVHLAATAAWIGSLPPLARLLADAPPPAAGRLVARYGAYGGLAVGLLIASGLALAWLMIGGAADPWSGGFARLLAVKLGLLAVMGGLGLANRFLLGPRLAEPAVAARMRQVVFAEYAVGCLILAAAALLANTAPP